MKTPQEIARDQAKSALVKLREAVDGPHPANSGLDSFTLAHVSHALDMAEPPLRTLVDAERREGVILSAHDGWRVWCATPSEIYEQIRDLEADGYDITELTWEPA